MFKFAIRELLLLVLVLALGMGWGVDAWRNARKKLSLRQGFACALYQCSLHTEFNVEVGVCLPDGEVVSANSGLRGRHRMKPIMLDCSGF